MAKPSSGTSGLTVMPVVIADPVPTPVVVVPPALDERKQIEKEIMGLSAKLRWEHMDEGLKDVWRARIAELREKLGA